MRPRLSSWEIAAYAVHVLGGTSGYVGTESVALKCFELAPDSFSWVTRPDIPDKDIVRIALIHAREPQNGALVTGRSGRGRGLSKRTRSAPAADGWMLTQNGVKWIAENGQRVSETLGYREVSAHRQDQLHKLSRIRSHALFQEYIDRPQVFSPALSRMADLFRCRVDSDKLTWKRRFQTTRNVAQAAKDEMVLDFLEKCERALENQASSS